MTDSDKIDSVFSTEDDVKAKESSEPAVINDDLNNLLDSAIDDFDKPLPKVTQETPPVNAAASSAKNQGLFSCNPSNKGFTDDEFKHVQDAMKSFLQEDPNLQAQLDQLTGGASSSTLGASLDEAMKFISDSAQNIPAPSPEELEQIVNSFGKFGLPGDDNGGQIPGFMPFFQSFMENLLSKEVLYPALKDIVAKYPQWIEENKQRISQKDHDNYVKQYEIMTLICEEFESEHNSSNEGQKSFEKILGLMQKMQEYGNPPEDIMSDFSSTLPFDELNSIKDGTVSDQCSIM